MPTAREILSDKRSELLLTIAPDATALEAIRKMNHHRVGALIVMDAGRIAGIFTERDVLQRVVGVERNPSEIQVGDVMTRNVVCAPPDTDIEELSEIMRAKRIRHVPICDEDGDPMGLVSIGDVNAKHANHQQATIHYLSEYIYGRV
jgi:CBS domain-containing protein